MITLVGGLQRGYAGVAEAQLQPPPHTWIFQLGSAQLTALPAIVEALCESVVVRHSILKQRLLQHIPHVESMGPVLL